MVSVARSEASGVGVMHMRDWLVKYNLTSAAVGSLS
jgi:hypothetical protein